MSEKSTLNKNTAQFTPESNLACRHRFTCGARFCLPNPKLIEGRPVCWIEKYSRYQPDSYSNAWYEKNWDELKQVTWYDVFSLKESWLYLLILLIIAVFIFYCATLIVLYTGR